MSVSWKNKYSLCLSENKYYLQAFDFFVYLGV